MAAVFDDFEAAPQTQSTASPSLVAADPDRALREDFTPIGRREKRRPNTCCTASVRLNRG